MEGIFTCYLFVCAIVILLHDAFALAYFAVTFPLREFLQQNIVGCGRSTTENMKRWHKTAI